MTFSHNGTGLPRERGGVLYILMGLWTLARVLHDFASPDPFVPLDTVAYIVAWLGVALIVIRPPIASLWLLVGIVAQLTECVLRQFGVTCEYAYFALVGWQCAAFFVTFSRMMAQTDSKKKQN